MIRCANVACGKEHRGPREAFDAHHEMARVLHQAAAMRTDEGRDYLRINFLRLGLELSNFCPGCVLNTQVSIGAVASESLTAVRETEQAMEAVTDPRHVCTILPFRRPATQEAVARDLLNIGSIHDTERKP